MPRDPNAIYQGDSFADGGDVTDPVTHGITLSAGYDVSYEQAGGNRPPRQVFNWFWRLVTSFISEINRRGLPEWDASIDYEHPAAVLGSNSQIYTSTADSGPNSGGAVDPTGLMGSTRWRSSQGTTPPNATTGQRGIIEIAEDDEVREGTDGERAVSPSGLSARTATTSRSGIVTLASPTDADVGTDGQKAMTPALTHRVVASVSEATVPTGTLIDYAGIAAPVGFLACNGIPVSRVTYETLFNAIGIRWGAGDGSSTFNLPDLRGRFAFGSDGSRAVGDLGGSESVMLSEGQLPTHSHDDGSLSASSGGSHSHPSAGSHAHGAGSYVTDSEPDHSHTIETRSGAQAGQPTYVADRQLSPTDSASTDPAGAHSHTISGSSASGGSHSHGSAGSHSHTVSGSTGSTGSNQSHPNMPPFAAVLVCIKT